MAALDGWTIGFIGLGLMGRPMTENLLAAGATVVGYNRSQVVIKELSASGLRPTRSPSEVAKAADTVILMLPDTDTVQQILLGEQGVVGDLQAAALVIDMGTTAIMATRRFASTVADADGHYVDAPVSGGAVGARDATLSIMVGGSPEAFDRAEPIFKVLGRNISHVGDVSAGQVAKTVNQVIVGLTIGAVSEALVLAETAGVDPAKVRDALIGGFATSRILELHGKRMIDDNFEPGGRAKTQRKDMFEATEFASTLGIELPALNLNLELYDKLLDRGWGDLDHSALYKLIKDLQKS
ncbi:MAG: NAD(P)-dependent oxidoreductase [Rhodospirillaceae bacterium]|nr:NAD(P)-dependent oxidoreductase [Rhodospirillaceae bacterium]